MNLSEQDIELTERYLDGTLKNRELSSFEQRLEEDDIFKQNVATFKAIKAGIDLEVLSGLMAEMDTWEEEHKATDQTNKHLNGQIKSTKEHLLNVEPNDNVIPIDYKKSSRTIWIRVGSIAAVIFMVGTFIWIERGPSKMDLLIQENFEHYPSNIIFTRSTESSDLSQLKSKAYGLYEIREYALSAPLLEQLFTQEKDTLSLFYSGISYLGSGNLKKAEDLLNRFDYDVEESIKLQYQDLISELKDK